MDELFRDIENESIDSNGFESHAESTPKRKRLSRTKITAYLSPIASNNNSHSDDTSMHDDDQHSKSLNESSFIEKSYQSHVFSPKWNSTPKVRKTRSRSKNEIKGFKSRKQSKEQPNITLWDRAMTKNPELVDWIESFNKTMDLVESVDLSTTDISIETSDNINSPK